MAKRMILVDPDQTSSGRQPVISNPTIESARTLDDHLKSIIDSGKDNDYNKLSEYHQTLMKYLNRVSQLKEGMSVPEQRLLGIKPESSKGGVHNSPNKVDLIRRRVVDSLPKTLQTKGRLLLEHLDDLGDVGWNTRGELIKKGEVIDGSNLSDLVHEVLRARKISHHPRGWAIFAKTLKESNVPNNLIGNKLKWENPEITEKKELATSPETSFSTPVSRVPSKQRRKNKTRTSPWIHYYHGE